MHLAAASAAAECLWTGLQPGQAPNCLVSDSGSVSTPAAGVLGPRAFRAGSPSRCQACKKVTDSSLKTGMHFNILRLKEQAVQVLCLQNGWMACSSLMRQMKELLVFAGSSGLMTD